jgi:hypothetical protein
MGNHIPRAPMLAEIDALFTTLLTAGAGQSMLWLDPLSVRAIVVVVVNVSMRGQILFGCRVVRRYLCHFYSPLCSMQLDSRPTRHPVSIERYSTFAALTSGRALAARAFWTGDAEALASSVASASCYSTPENVGILAVVVTEGEFIQVQRQIFLGDIVVGADNSALQERPKVLDIRRVNFAAHVLALAMLDSLVRVEILQIGIADIFVGRDEADLICDGLFDKQAKRVGCGVLNNLADNISLARYRSDDRRLASVGQTTTVILRADVRMAILLLAAEERFVNLDNTHQLAKFLISQPSPQTMAHEPRRAVRARADHAMDLQGTDSFLAGQHQVQNLEPSQKRIIGILEDGARDDGEPIGRPFSRAALHALPRKGTRFASVNLVILATRAQHAVRPALRHQVCLAGRFIGKHPIKFHQSHLSGDFRFASFDFRVHEKTIGQTMSLVKSGIIAKRFHP